MLSYYLNFFKINFFKPSFKFCNNLFFLIYMFSINFNHAHYPHIFLNTKYLSIKWLKSKLNISVSIYIYMLLTLYLIYSFLFIYM